MPMYSDFHTFNVELRMLECTKRFESGVSIAAQKDFVEESELFNRDPLSWLHSHWKIEEKPLYDIVVIYDKIYRKTEHFWQNHGYRIEHTIFHTHFTSSDDQDTQILILKIKN